MRTVNSGSSGGLTKANHCFSLHVHQRRTSDQRLASCGFEVSSELSEEQPVSPTRIGAELVE